MLAVASIEASESDCRVVPGHVEFRGLELDPPNPRAGDVVSLSFDVVTAVYFVSSVHLYGTGGYLHGTTSGGDASFILHAVSPGDAVLQVAVVYGTEEYCEAGGYFRPGPLLTATSPEYEVAIGESLPAPCPGDCNGDGRVDVTEIMTAINIKLARVGAACLAADANNNGVVAINELVAAILANLHGCAGA